MAAAFSKAVAAVKGGDDDQDEEEPSDPDRGGESVHGGEEGAAEAVGHCVLLF
jgi:hypothetical protein